jgi:hypothetical protein
MARVSGCVLVGGKPARGVIVALVQPRAEAAYLPETRQLVGARSLPMWRGRSAKSDDRGVFQIWPVTAGDYEVVVGFDDSAVPQGYVLSAAPRSVTVVSKTVEFGDIRFVPRIKLVQPEPGTATDSRPVVKWTEYPGATSYAVSILRSPDTEGVAGRHETCWLKAGVRGATVQVTRDGFRNAAGSSSEAAHEQFLAGQTYLCWVYAYDAAGRLLATSEDYYGTGMDSFTVSPRARRPQARTSQNGR